MSISDARERLHRSVGAVAQLLAGIFLVFAAGYYEGPFLLRGEPVAAVVEQIVPPLSVRSKSRRMIVRARLATGEEKVLRVGYARGASIGSTVKVEHVRGGSQGRVKGWFGTALLAGFFVFGLFQLHWGLRALRGKAVPAADGGSTNLAGR